MADSERAPSSRRRVLMIGMTAVFAVALAGFLLYQHFYGSLHESTEDAYVSGNLVQLTPQISGTALAIYADDTDLVHAGQTIVKLDESDRRIALEQAEAELAQAVREVRVLFASRDQLTAEVAVRDAELARAAADVQRREGLSARGLVPREELDHARDDLNTAKAALQAARESLAAMKARIDGTRIENHPNVIQASAKLKDAYLALQRTTLIAPITGHVAKRSVQVGQRVEPGVPLMAIVPLSELWVDANFKEGQLRRMRIGQKAKVIADLYGSRVEYEGEVVGVGMGTGAAFALLPAQNASGNWIKVVQRVPVRIRLNPKQLEEHPLRIGLSMHVDVDLRQDGPQLAELPRERPIYETTAYSRDSSIIDQHIREIVAANVGLPVSASPVTPKPAVSSVAKNAR